MRLDVLWDHLTAAEHLELYAGFKGLERHEIAQEVHDRLEDVQLLSKGDAEAGSFSGGMKRRLSVAVSLIGNPAVVYLDGEHARTYMWNYFASAVSHAISCLSLTMRALLVVGLHAEPTTGMDAVSRRHVWNLIEKVKRQRICILTTHRCGHFPTCPRCCSVSLISRSGCALYSY